MNVGTTVTHNKDHGKLPFRHIFGYSTGQMVEGVVVHSCNVFLFFYLTAVCGLSSSLAGIALALGLIVDAILDPLIGSLSDNLRTRFGRRLPFMVCGIGPLVASFILIFSLPSGLSEWSLFLLASSLSLTMRVSLSVFLLPYMALSAELTDDYHQRSVINTWRWGIGILGALVAIALGFGIFFDGENGLMQRESYTPFAVTISVLVVMGAALSMLTAHATRKRQFDVVQETSSIFTVFRELGETFRNPSFKVLFTGSLLFFVGIGVHTTLGLHGNTYFWGLNSDQVRLVTLSIFVGLVLGAPCAGPFLKKYEKRTVLFVGMAGLVLTQGLPPSLRIAGLLPLTGDTLAITLALFTMSGGVLVSAAAIAFGSMIADSADEHEHLFGARREGLYFAGWMFASKAAIGAGSLVSGFGLEFIGFDVPNAQHGEVEIVQQSSDVVTDLGLLYGPGVAFFGLIATGIVCMYRLDREKHAELLSELKVRRASSTYGNA